MVNFVLGLFLIAFAAVMGFYGTQLARDGWAKIFSVPSAVADTENQPVNIQGNGNIVTQGQTGGNNIVMNQAPAPRRLSDQQQVMLIDALKSFHGQRVSIFCLRGDHESLDFVKDFIKMFSAAGWTHNGTGINQIEVSNMTLPKGIGVLHIQQGEVLSGEIQKANNVLSSALISAGLAKSEMYISLPFPREGKVFLWIGRKPE